MQELNERFERFEKELRQQTIQIKRIDKMLFYNQPLIGDRYRDLGDGTVLDTQTNLQWMRCALGQTWNGQTCVGEAKQFSWDNAIKVAKDTRHAGYTDWRLPTIDELKTLIVTGQNPTINQQAFPNTLSAWFWSASPNASNSSSAWYVNFSSGFAGNYNRNVSNHVRLVRDRQ
ncbi:DUF1566 domain-containing protein [Chromatium okenii]|uniref:Lcl C-terminal domain-containing protein n=1 Tax=Chromatium okenii TaxID=61644 RepID=UPI001907AA4B|nr:DUF1566 domain-containing protein [Chromatium okenii]